MKIFKTTLMIACLLGALALTSCNAETDEPTNQIPTELNYDFVTLVEKGQSSSTFTLRKASDTPLVTYTCGTSLVSYKEIEEGMRMIIGYTCVGHEPYTSGEINLYGVRMLNDTEQNVLIGTETEYHNWASEPTIMDVLTRTGQYINMQMKVYGTNSLQIKTLVLVADQATIENEVVDLYLICDTGVNGINEFIAYASFDISQVWNLDTCKGVRIHFNDNHGSKTQIFANPHGGPIPME